MFLSSGHIGFVSNLDQFSSNIFFLLSYKIVSYGQISASSYKLLNQKKLLHLLSQGYANIFCLLFCQAGVNSHNPIGGKNFCPHLLFFWGGGGLKKREKCF